MDLPKECNQEAAEVEENVHILQEEITVSNNFPKTEEINVSQLCSHMLQNRKTLCKWRTVLSSRQLEGTQKRLSFFSCLTQVKASLCKGSYVFLLCVLWTSNTKQNLSRLGPL